MEEDILTEMRQKTDDELVSLYAIQMFRDFPSNMTLSACTQVIKERNITMRKVEVKLFYIDSQEQEHFVFIQEKNY